MPTRAGDDDANRDHEAARTHFLTEGQVVLPRMLADLGRWLPNEESQTLRMGLTNVRTVLSGLVTYVELAVGEVEELYGPLAGNPGNREMEPIHTACTCQCKCILCLEIRKLKPGERMDWYRKRGSRAGIKVQERAMVAFNAAAADLGQAFKSCIDARTLTEPLVKRFYESVDRALDVYVETYTTVEPYRPGGSTGRKWHLERGFFLNLPFDFFAHALLNPLDQAYRSWDNTRGGGGIVELGLDLTTRRSLKQLAKRVEEAVAIGQLAQSAQSGSASGKQMREEWKAQNSGGLNPVWTRRYLDPLLNDEEEDAEEDEDENEEPEDHGTADGDEDME